MAYRVGLICLTVFLLLGISFSLEQRALAYVDPGSGLLILQSFGAMFTGALFYFRRRLKSYFTRTRSRNTTIERR